MKQARKKHSPTPIDTDFSTFKAKVSLAALKGDRTIGELANLVSPRLKLR